MPRSSPYSARCNARYGSIGGARGGSNGNSQSSPERHCSQLGSLVLVAFSTRWTHSGSTSFTVLLTKTSVAGVLLTKESCGVRARRSCRSGRWVDELDVVHIRHTRASSRTAMGARAHEPLSHRGSAKEARESESCNLVRKSEDVRSELGAAKYRVYPFTFTLICPPGKTHNHRQVYPSCS